MSPPTPEPKPTHTKPRQVLIPWEDWRDYAHAVKAAPADRELSPRQRDRAANLRRFIAWYTHRRGANQPKRPAIKDWAAAAAADTAVPKNPDTPRQIRIGDDEWRDFEHAAKAVGKDRAQVIREYIAWYLRRPTAGGEQSEATAGTAQLPERPERDTWLGDAPIRDDWHDLKYAARAIGMSGNEVVNEFVAWFLRRPAALLPRRPALEEWRAAARNGTDEPDTDTGLGELK